MKKILSTLILGLAVVSTGAFAAESSTATKPTEHKTAVVTAKHKAEHKHHSKKHHSKKHHAHKKAVKKAEAVKDTKAADVKKDSK